MTYKPDKIDNLKGVLIMGVKEEMKPRKYIQKGFKHSQYFCVDVLHSPCQQYQQEASQEWRFILSIYSSSSPIIFLSQHLILNHLQDSNIQPTSFSTISNTSPDISSLALKTYSPNFDMQLQQLLLLGLSAGAYANTVASGVSCWQSGPVVSVSNIAPSIATICNYLQGSAYVPQEERYQCVQDAAGVMWDFSLTYIGSAATRPIGTTECQNGMNKQIQCQYGGETSYANWKYRADPNFGTCTG